MERCSVFIQGKALFSGFPNQEMVNKLEEQGVRYFVDLTENTEEKLPSYTTKYTYIHYPIVDHSIPKNWRSFAQLIIKCCDIIKKLNNNEYILIHCKGGHSRSGILVACVLVYLYGISPSEAIEITTQSHASRPVMNDKWRKRGSPHGKKQIDFVYNFFRPLYYSNRDMGRFSSVLHNYSHHKVILDDVEYNNARSAFIDLRKKAEKIFDPKTDEFWEEKKINFMRTVLYNKFSQHIHIKKILMNTGLRPLIKKSNNSFWGVGTDGTGKNIHGKLLEELRLFFLNIYV